AEDICEFLRLDKCGRSWTALQGIEPKTALPVEGFQNDRAIIDVRVHSSPFCKVGHHTIGEIPMHIKHRKSRLGLNILADHMLDEVGLPASRKAYDPEVLAAQEVGKDDKGIWRVRCGRDAKNQISP